MKKRYDISVGADTLGSALSLCFGEGKLREILMKVEYEKALEQRRKNEARLRRLHKHAKRTPQQS